MVASDCTVVRGGRVLDPARSSCAPADLLIRDGRIECLGPPGMPAPAHAATVQADDRLIIPGLVNAHTHGHGSLSKGVGVGADGAQCADNQNMFEAMRFAAYLSRVRDHDPERWLSSRDVLRMATAGGARVLGFGDAIGRIAPGALADLVFLDLGHLNWIPVNDPVNQLVNTEDGSAVDGVMVGGRTVLWNGRFTSGNLEQVRRQVEQAVEHMRTLNHDLRALAERLEPLVSRFCVGLASGPYHVHAMASAGEAPGQNMSI